MTGQEERGGGIQVIARAASVMRALADNPGGLSLAQIAERVGLARSTVQRIVQALEAERFVELSGPQGGFQLGPELARMLYRRQIDIVSVARPFLERLCAELHESVALCMLNGDEVTALDRCVAERVLRVVFPLGTIPLPARDLAPGLAIMAESPELPAARSDPELARRLDAVRASGRARDRNDDFVGFSVALRSPLGVHALVAVVPESRAEGRDDQIFAELEACRDALAGRLGSAG